MLRATTLVGVAVSLLSAPVLAHHSFAMFDPDTTFELEATVMEFQWTNPHSWLEVMITDDQGQMTHWSIEMGAPRALSRDGWRPTSVVSGDEVTVSFHPRRDGTPTGQFVSLVLPNGEKIGENSAPGQGGGTVNRGE